MARTAAVVVALCFVLACTAGADDLPRWLRDRGDAIPTSLVGTYVRSHELLVYSFYEYTLNRDQEYKPAELGFGLEHDYRAQRIDHEALVMLTYGFNDRVAFELESAVHAWANQRKALDDPSAVPPRLTEDGFGDTQAELRWKWSKETAGRPELFSYFEAVFPFQKRRILIGTQDWELVQGFGAIKGFGFGTLTGRVSASYTHEDGQVVFGEYDAEYLRRLNDRWRCAVSVEGEQDELELIPEIQWHFGPRAFAKFNSGFGLTSKTPDFAPEVGVVMSFGAR
ncbi:MAG TPA: hypothetical protein VL123_06570 [Candidatus Udaeobacter sp.]|jgi:hypothetical protein|nr:hypothetical protein [Candidatus Udaeobacter sp.]